MKNVNNGTNWVWVIWALHYFSLNYDLGIISSDTVTLEKYDHKPFS